MKKLMTYLMLLAMLPIDSFGATTGSLTLSGSIPVAVAITITGQAGYNTLNLTANAVNQVVAVVNESSNDPLGYVVKLTSANAGKLMNGANQLTYTARYNGTAVVLSLTPQTVTNVASQVAIVNANKNFDISFTGSSSLMAGTYFDTVTVTIQAN